MHVENLVGVSRLELIVESSNSDISRNARLSLVVLKYIFNTYFLFDVL